MDSHAYSLTPEQEDLIFGVTDVTILSPDSTRAEQPINIKTQLKQHQLAMIEYCKNLEKTGGNPIRVVSEEGTDNEHEYEVSTNIGVVGDIVGSGKTLSILGLISSTLDTPLNNNELNQSKNHNHRIFRAKCIKEPNKIIDELNISLVVVPHTIFKQWSKTLSEETDLKFLPINSKKTFEKIEEYYIKDYVDSLDHEPNTNEEGNVMVPHSWKWNGKSLETYDILLVSSTFYTKFVSLIYGRCDYMSIKFKRVIFDEADSIKIIGGYLPKNSFVWYVSSTYRAIFNPHGKRMWINSAGEISENLSYASGFTQRITINGMINKGFLRNEVERISNIPDMFLKHLIVKNQNEFISQAFNLEQPIETLIKCKMPLSLQVLSNVASQEILAFINGGDIQGAVESLNCDKVSESGLIDAVTKDLQNSLENKYIELEMKSKMNWSSEQAKKESLAKIQLKINELKMKISNIKEKLEDSTHCNICFNTEMECPTIVPCCNSKFCFECVTTWLVKSNSCAFCRAKMSPSNLIVIDDSAEIENTEKELDKMETLKALIMRRIDETSSQSTGLKMLIFTEYSRTFDKMAKILDFAGVKYAKVIGSGNVINKKVMDYKSNGDDKIDCLLLNAEHCASGLNLENTTDIIITHKMSTEKTTQIIGRGQRPGRIGRLNVWKLYYETEM